MTGAATAPFLDWPTPLALAHRGGAAEVPENSYAAIEHATSLGYRYLETDLHRTADGVAVLLHDDTLDRTTNGTGPLARLTWDQASRLRDHSGGRLVRLDEVLADFPELRLNLDVKEDAVVGPALRVVAEAGAGDRVCFASFSDRRLRAVRRLTEGAVATSLGRGEIARLLVTGRAGGRPAPPADASVAHAVCVQAPPRHRGLTVVTPQFVRRAHRLGLQVHVWTIDDAPTMHRLLDMGVDGIVTDRPTLLRSVLTDRGLWVDQRVDQRVDTGSS